MTKPALLAAATLTLAVLSLTVRAARADALPDCPSLQDQLITCAAADVGKPCEGGGQCYEMSCSNSGTIVAGKIYKCDACPTIIPATEPCDYNTMGKACGGEGGTGNCGVVPPHCITAGVGKFACKAPPAATPTGPPPTGAAGTSGSAGTTGSAGSTGSMGSSGCDVAPRPGKPTLIGLGLVMAGLVFFAIDRARRRNR
jgi:hypothetical protein